MNTKTKTRSVGLKMILAFTLAMLIVMSAMGFLLFSVIELQSQTVRLRFKNRLRIRSKVLWSVIPMPSNCPATRM